MFFKIVVLKNFTDFLGKHLCWSFFLINFIKNRLQHRCFPMKFTKLAASENNEQQQLSEGFFNSCYKIVSPVLPQKIINDFAISKHCSGTLYLLKMQLVATVLETRTTYFKKEPHFLIDQPRTCCIFMLRCIKSVFFN